MEHVELYYHRQHFAAWPFNHGFWAFPGGELLVGFSRGPCRYERSEDLRHATVDALGGEYVSLRSLDDGHTWPVEGLQSWGTRQSIDQAVLDERAPAAPAAPLDWTSADFCLTAGFGIPPPDATHVG